MASYKILSLMAILFVSGIIVSTASENEYDEDYAEWGQWGEDSDELSSEQEQEFLQEPQSSNLRMARALPVYIQYGYICDNTSATEICNPEGHLTCSWNQARNATVCACKDSTWYPDFWRNTCVLKAGEPCIRDPHDGTFPTPCTNNSYCHQLIPNNPGTCECDFGTITTGDQRCQLGFDEACTSIPDCDITAFLTCDGGKCTCSNKEGPTTWNDEKELCVSLFGGSCAKSPGAAKERECFATGFFCDETTWKCGCNTDFEPSSDNYCFKSYGVECDSNPECFPGYSCVIESSTNATVCGCLPSELAVNSGTTENPSWVCLQKAGQPCIPPPEEEEDPANTCIKFATCRNVTLDGHYSCTCDEKYSSNNDRLCFGELDADCILEEDCHLTKLLTCDAGKCQCKANYTVIDGSCKGNINAECVDNADCKTGRCDPIRKVCLCPTNTEEVNGKCVLGHGAECGTEEWECNREGKFLECLEGVCDCPPEHLAWVEGGTKCVAKIGSPCSAGNVTCVPSANCFNEKCVCYDTHEPDGTGFCKGKVVATTPRNSGVKVDKGFVAFFAILLAVVLKE